MDLITENPALGTSEIWEIHNFTADAHPIHVHLVHFEVVNREDADGNVRLPEAWETGPKDTVISYPGEITRIKMLFDLPGFYVWHCHIVEHEDNEMMRPYHVGPIPPNAPAQKRKVDIAKAAGVATTFELKQNYPNPFNPSTTINFRLPSDERVVLKVYNSRGQLVKSLIDRNYASGTHSVSWDGTNDRGRSVASGVYIYRIKAGKYTKSVKMNLVR